MRWPQVDGWVALYDWDDGLLSSLSMFPLTERIEARIRVCITEKILGHASFPMAVEYKQGVLVV